MSCPECRADNPVESRFCGQCGARLEAPAAAVERRHLTVMFCDLVGSTALSERLDPEELHEVIGEYQQSASATIRTHGGHVAQHLGDGLLVYFGFPKAHEDDAARSIRAALDIVRRMETLETAAGERLRVRIGIHSGMVVTGPVGEGSQQERLALGETPNVAARLQSLATPDQVVVSEQTARLAEGHFDLEPLGGHELKGLSREVSVFRVGRELDVGGRFDAKARKGLTPWVGRSGELRTLEACWRRVEGGDGTAVLLRGEGGVGKSRLIRELRDRHRGSGSWWVDLSCSPQHRFSAFHPVLDGMRREAGCRRSDSAEMKRGKLAKTLEAAGLAAEEALGHLAPFVSDGEPGDRPAAQASPERQKALAREVLRRWILRETDGRRTCVVVEDLHWADPSTLELVRSLAEGLSERPALLLLTHRPEIDAPIPEAANVRSLDLSALSEADARELIGRVAGGPVASELVDLIVSKTDGVPLFVEELTKTLLESDAVKRRADRYELTLPLADSTIPVTLRDSLMARLDRLGWGKTVAQLGAVVGRSFDPRLLAEVAEIVAARLSEGLRALVDAGLAYELDPSFGPGYKFKHALVQDIAYESLPRKDRARHHRKLGELLAASDDTPHEIVARHLTLGGAADRAVPHWIRAGEVAIRRSANEEATGHLRQALALIEDQAPGDERHLLELRAQTTLGYALMSRKGYGDEDVVRAYTRAHALAREVGGRVGLGPILYGLYSFYCSRGEYEPADEIARRLRALGREGGDPAVRTVGELAIGTVAFLRGRLADALEPLEASRRLADGLEVAALAEYGGDFRGYARSWLALTHCLDGRTDEAWGTFEEGLRLTEEQPYTRAFLLCFCPLAQLVGDVERARAVAEELSETAEQHGFTFLGVVAGIHRGWCEAVSEGSEEEVEAIAGALGAVRSVKLDSFLPMYLGLLADAQLSVGRAEDARASLAEALDLVVEAGGSFYAAELHRLEAELGRATPAINRESRAGRAP